MSNRGRPRRQVADLPPEIDAQIAEAVAGFFDDPLGFVLFAFPWNDPAGPLAGKDGPDRWQAKVLDDIGRSIRAGMEPGGAVRSALRVAVTSGHGVGKSAMIAWIIQWFMSTRPNARITVTANTKTQLSTKTWPELALWHKLAINQHWFVWSAESFKHRESPETWAANAIPWSKDRPEAFAGLHADHVMVIFDEASSIPDVIWETTEGALTTPGAMWVVCGNPTRNDGRFRQCFTRFKERWLTYKVDGRKAKVANQVQLQEWIEDYGEDSDFCRVRIFGEFPRSSVSQLIALDIVEAAMRNTPDWDAPAPMIFGLDVARFGDDASELWVRKGRSAKRLARWRELDGVQLAYRVGEFIQEYRPDAVFVDAVGTGSGCYDMLVHLGYDVIDVNGGYRASDERKYFNKRAEMWVEMRDWIKRDAAIEADDDLRDDLTGVNYAFSGKGQIQLERKEDMKARIGRSPDAGDALSMTFFAPVAMPVAEESILARIRAGETRHTSWMAA